VVFLYCFSKNYLTRMLHLKKTGSKCKVLIKYANSQDIQNGFLVFLYWVLYISECIGQHSHYTRVTAMRIELDTARRGVSVMYRSRFATAVGRRQRLILVVVATAAAFSYFIGKHTIFQTFCLLMNYGQISFCSFCFNFYNWKSYCFMMFKVFKAGWK
jgi:hypothetical protein